MVNSIEKRISRSTHDFLVTNITKEYLSMKNQVVLVLCIKTVYISQMSLCSLSNGFERGGETIAHTPKNLIITP